MIEVRNIFAGEELPEGLKDTGTPYLDPEWAWVVCKNGETLAVIVTSFAHGWLVLWRVIALPSAPPNWFLEAMHKVFENAKKRGCLGILTMLSDEQEAEVKMARMISRMGGALVPFRGSVAVASIA